MPMDIYILYYSTDPLRSLSIKHTYDYSLSHLIFTKIHSVQDSYYYSSDPATFKKCPCLL